MVFQPIALFSSQTSTSTSPSMFSGPTFIDRANRDPLPWVMSPAGSHLVMSFMYLVVFRWSSTYPKTVETGALMFSLTVIRPMSASKLARREEGSVSVPAVASP